MKRKEKFRVSGQIENAGIKFLEWVWAYSEAQAIKLTHFRLEKKYPDIKIFLVDVEVMRPVI